MATRKAIQLVQTVLTNAFSTYATVPSSGYWEVTEILCVNNGAGSVNFRLRSNGTVEWFRQAVASGGYFRQPCFTVLKASDTIEAIGASSLTYLTISGIEVIP